MSQTDLVARSIVGASGISLELINEIERIVVHAKEAGQWPAETLAAVRAAVQQYEPLLAEHIADATLASWIQGFNSVAKQFPAWLQREFESSKRREPPNPPENFRLMGMFDSEPELRFPAVEQAAKRLLERNILTRSQFDAATTETKLQSFTVAGGLGEDTIERLRDFLMDDLIEGTSLDTFRARVEDHLGTSPIAPGHLETVYRTNVQSAFRDGRETLRSNPIVSATFPYQRYICIHDGRTRTEHRDLAKLGLNGTGIYRTDDPFWDHFTPPWDYNCRCTAVLLTLEQAAAAGVREAQIWLKTGKPPMHPEYRLAHIPFDSKPSFGSRGQVGIVALSLVRMSQFRAPSGYSRSNPLVINGVEYVGGEWIPADQFAKATKEQKEAIEEGKKFKPDLTKFKPTEDQQAVLTMIGRNGRSFPVGQDVLASRHRRSIEALVGKGVIERTQENGSVTYKRAIDVSLGAPNTKLPPPPAPKPAPQPEPIAATEQAPEPKATKKPKLPRKSPDAGNYHYRSRKFLSGGLKAKYRDNVEAIRTMKTLQLENRAATPEEQEKLSKYVGWGQFPSLFSYDYRNSGEYYKWSKEREELESLLGPDEFAKARASTINAHFTSPEVVDTHWAMAKRLGFDGGRYLEPAVGSGYYIGLMPEELAKKTYVTAVEMEPTTGEIAQKLYPSANVQISPFQRYHTPDDFYDLVATNVPFSSEVRIKDPKYKAMKPTLHDYYFLRSVDTAKPGGLIMHLTSAGTMDKLDDRVRKHINQNAELVAAVRFPGDAHKENAGTSVVTDMIILRKKHPDIPPVTDETPSEAEPKAAGFTGTTVDSLGRLYHWIDGKRVAAPRWDDIVEVPDPAGGDPIPVNRYFAEHPEQILGTLDRTGSMYTGDQMNVSRTDDYDKRVKDAIDRLPAGAFWADKATKAEEAKPERIEATQQYPEGALVIKDGVLYQHFNGALEPQDVSGKALELVGGQIAIRDAARRLIAAQRTGEGIDEARAALNSAYDSFVDKHGSLHAKANRNAMKTDPDSSFLLSLENWNATKKEAAKADLFTKNTIRQMATADKASSVMDATGITLNEMGSIDVDRIAKLVGKSREDVEDELVESGLAFRDPNGGKWTTAADYLSGNTRKKLKEARDAAALDPAYEANVKALEKAQPEDIDPEDIGIKLGSPWVPADVISQFSGEVIGMDPENFKIKYVDATGDWHVEPSKYVENRRSNFEVWGVKDDNDNYVADYTDVLKAALTGKPITVRSAYSDENNVHHVLPEQTEAAAEKVQELRDRFKEWVWNDPDRREMLFRHYNDNYNNIVPTHYDGSHLTFPGMRDDFKMRDIQKDFVWRVVTTGKGLAAHEVGTGKTATMIASAMELRRLGLAKKPALCVLKSNIEQITKEAQELYPGAKILSTADMFDAKKRQKTLNQIATGDYDMIIMTHDHLDSMKMKPETQQKFIQEEIDELSDSILAARGEAIAQGTKKQTDRIVKQLEAQKQKLEENLREALADQGKDDIFFEDSGIDFLMVDEAHNFKSLPCYTRRGQVKGIPNQRSQRATNMLARTRWLLEQNKGRGVLFATGTPISNTMGELFNMQRYLQFDSLKERNLHRFDAWADTYGDIVSKIEFKLNGDTAPTSRFSEFVNLPELRHLASEFMDVQRADNLKNPDGSPVIKRPKRHDNVVISEENDAVREMMKGIHERADALKTRRRAEKGEDNMLNVCNDAKLGSIDMRLIDPNAEDHPDSKLNQCVRKVLELYKEHPGKTQCVFSDLGVHENDQGFSVFSDMRKKLIAGGIPESEIADFSDESMKDAKRDEAQAAAKRGEVRVMFGSTKRLGTGTNVQDHLIGIHHLDIPYVPAALEQRDGRGYRSGNKNSDINIYKYVQQGSADNLFWQIVANKSNFINQYMLGKGARSMKDLDTETLTPDEMIAVSTGDEEMLERVALEDEVRKLRRSRIRYESDKRSMEDTVAKAPTALAALEQKRNDHKRDSQAFEENKDFSLKIGKSRFTERKDADKSLAEAVTAAQQQYAEANSWEKPKEINIGNYKGAFDVSVMPDGMLELTGPSGQRYRSGPTLQSLEIAARSAGKRAAEVDEKIRSHKSDTEKMRAQLSAPWRAEKTLQEKEARLEQLKQKGKRLSLMPGVTKVFNGKTYTLNEHHRWTIPHPQGGGAEQPSVRQNNPNAQSSPAQPAANTSVTQTSQAENRSPIQPEHPNTRTPEQPAATTEPAPAPRPLAPPEPPDQQTHELAASLGDTPRHRAAREHVALHYLSTQATFYDHRSGKMVPLDTPRVTGMLEGIDLAHPVRIGPPPQIPPPFEMVQFQAAGGFRGSYYSIPGMKPEDLGIYGHATAWNLPGKPVLPRQQTSYDTRNAKFDRMSYLHSVAAPTIDTWSVPGNPKKVSGGGQQWYIPSSSHPNANVRPKNEPANKPPASSNQQDSGAVATVSRSGNGGRPEATGVS